MSCVDSYFCESLAMGALQTRDLARALTFVGELNEIDGTEPFTTALLDRLRELVPCEFVTYWAFDIATGDVSTYVPCSAEGETADADVPWTLCAGDLAELSSSVTVAWRRDTGQNTGVVTWSELVDRRRRLRCEVQERCQRQWGIVDHACLSLSASDAHVAWLSFDSTGRDFTVRDRQVIELLEPHFVTRVGAARLRRCFAALTAALEAGDESPALLIATPDGEIEYASEAARRLLETYFGETDGRLPQPLAEQRNGGPPAFTAVKNGTGLLIQGAGADGALLLREEPNVALTRRQRDVLRCIAAGKTSVETARLLWVTEATVSKHLEHVYRKLGVTNRAAALAKLNGSLH